MWKSTDFSRRVVGAKEEKGTIPFTHVCEHCKRLFVEDFLWWVAASHCGEKNLPSMIGWCGACGMPCQWRRPNGLLTMQIRDTTRIRASSQTESATTFFRALKLITQLVKGNKLGVVVKSVEEEGSKKKVTDALRQFTAADNQRALVTMGEFAKFREVRPTMPPTFY